MQTPESGSAPPSVMESIRALAGSVLALVHARAELLVLEFQEEKERHKNLLVLAAVAGLFLALGLQLLAFVVVVVFWDTYRVPAIVGVTGLYLGIGVWAVLTLRRRWRAAAKPFSASLQELGKDIEALGRRHE